MVFLRDIYKPKKGETDSFRILDDEIVEDGGTVKVPIVLMDGRRSYVAVDAGRPAAADHQSGYCTSDRTRQAHAAYSAYCRDAGLPEPPDADEAAAAKEKAYQARKKAVSEAWRGSSTPHTASQEDIDLATRIAPLLGLARPITASSAPPNTAWHRTSGGNYKPGGDDAVSDTAMADSDRAYAEYCNTIQNAWKRPIHDAPQPDTGSTPQEWRQHNMRTDPRILPPGEAQQKRDAAYQQYCDNLKNAWKTNPGAAGGIENQRARWLGR
jgi:hypothetical protein